MLWKLFLFEWKYLKSIHIFFYRFSCSQSSDLTLQLQRSHLSVTHLPDVEPQPVRPAPITHAKPHSQWGGRQCKAGGGGWWQEEGTLFTCHIPHFCCPSLSFWTSFLFSVIPLTRPTSLPKRFWPQSGRTSKTSRSSLWWVSGENQCVSLCLGLKDNENIEFFVF